MMKLYNIENQPDKALLLYEKVQGKSLVAAQFIFILFTEP